MPSRQPIDPLAASTHGLEMLMEELQDYGYHRFTGSVARPFLKRQNLPYNTLENSEWTRNGSANQVAAAVLEWARSHGASVYCHWFQPMCSGGLRHGSTGQVQMRMFSFDKSGELEWDFDGDKLLMGETDGSSYPNGGLRATHTAGAYLAIDTTSPIFLRGDTVFIPAVFVSYNGHSLDEKTPLLRAENAMSTQGTRLLRNLGYNVNKLQCNIGLEQEFFFVSREQFMRRPDLRMAGRTVMGRCPPRGQEMSDHYMAPPSATSPPLECMKEIQSEAYKMGIPLITRHREVGPAQYEFAPYFGFVTTQIDQNLMLMQVMEEVANRHGLEVLLQEKPFDYINGSGKHNNWSIGTDTGVNLLNVKQLAEKSGSEEVFPVVMSAIISAVAKHGDLMRMAIATPGNDFRLGGCEAPPAIVSTYLGASMTEYLDGYRTGKSASYQPQRIGRDIGVPDMPNFSVPQEDRNRTSPFPYGGHRFEFRAVGSSQNVSIVNVVLATICADAFKTFADKIEAGASPRDVASEALNENWKVIFNGNGYDPLEQEKLTKSGVWRIDSGVEAMRRIKAPKNIELFSQLNVLSPEECNARSVVMQEQYVGLVEIEVKVMIDMINQHVLPSLRRGKVGPISELEAASMALRHEWEAIEAMSDLDAMADAARVLRLESMVKVRKVCDEAEALCPADLWTLATYEELLFVDVQMGHTALRKPISGQEVVE